jgi:branched-chain amino acid transport system ATP-binding protein
MSLLALEGVHKRYGSLRVTDGISLRVEAGEALGIIGPNGAGKTTLFNLISGLVQPQAGTVHFEGRDVTKLAPSRRCALGVGRTFQVPHPFGGMTVFENVLVGAIFGANTSERQGRELAQRSLEQTGLIGKANTLAGSLPLLDRKRLELARALGTQPKLLLLDEIAGGLTEGECHELVACVRGIHAQGVAIVWIEHVVHALLAVVGRLAVINFGKLLQDGDPQTVIQSREVQEIYLGVEAAA